MAKDKKSFVLYTDLIHTVEKLPNATAGELFKHILRYVNDENPETDNFTIDIVFESIKQQLKRDLLKYEERAERSRSNGLKGGRPKKPRKPSGLLENPDEPRKPDSVSDSVTVNDSVNENVILLKSNTEWKNLLMKVHKIDLKEFERQVDLFSLSADMGRGFEKIKSHFANWIKQQELITNVKPPFEPYG